MDNNENNMVGRGAPEPKRSWRADKTLLARQAHRSENLPVLAVGERQKGMAIEAEKEIQRLTVENARLRARLKKAGIEEEKEDELEGLKEEVLKALGRAITVVYDEAERWEDKVFLGRLENLLDKEVRKVFGTGGKI